MRACAAAASVRARDEAPRPAMRCCHPPAMAPPLAGDQRATGDGQADGRDDVAGAMRRTGNEYVGHSAGNKMLLPQIAASAATSCLLGMTSLAVITMTVVIRGSRNSPMS